MEEPMPRRARLAAALTALALLAAAFAWPCRRRPPDPSGWDEPRLAAELQRLGYHTHAEPADRVADPGPGGRYRFALAGLYACRQEPADWDEVIGRGRSDARRWRGGVVAVRGSRSVSPGDPTYLALGSWTLFGDPAELDRVAATLGVLR
jgi:hypothetical protein